MKNKLLYVILVVAACIGVQGFAAEVTNVELSYVNGSTVANINVDGTIRFTHQTEEAKDGKPFRVIVDVLTATHELGAKNFMRLPDCSIEKLRTSQFSTSPEKIVRLVFDMKKETFYSINSNEQTISVTFPDKSHQSFTAWSSRSVIDAMKTEKSKSPKLATVSDTPKTSASEKTPATSAKTVGAINQSIERDRQVSLAPATKKVASGTSTPAEAKPVVKAEVKRAKAPYDARNSYGPDYDPELFASAAPAKVKQVAKADVPTGDAVSKAKPAVKKSSPAPAKTEVAKVEPKKELAVTTKPVVSKPKAASAKTEPKPSVKKSSPAAEPPMMAKTAPVQKSAPVKTITQEKKPAAKKTEKATVASKPTAKKAKKATVASKPTAKKAKKTTVASKPKKESKSATSRFRRSASKKIQGTLVAEFPKRLVIKYKSGSTHDPFETLVNDTRVNNSVIERSVPNVEGLKLVGVIESAGSDNRALFEDKSGYGYILKSGDKVRKGYVLRVESNRVYFQIFEYGWSRTVALNLEEN